MSRAPRFFQALSSLARCCGLESPRSDALLQQAFVSFFHLSERHKRATLHSQREESSSGRARLAQWKSTSFTRKGPQVQVLQRAPSRSAEGGHCVRGNS